MAPLEAVNGPVVEVLCVTQFDMKMTVNRIRIVVLGSARCGKSGKMSCLILSGEINCFQFKMCSVGSLND